MSFETKHKNNLKIHLLTHRAGYEVDMYQCEMCNFKTKYKVHRQNFEVEMYVCEACHFKTKHKVVLKKTSFGS
ncbi:hypothetical protein NQ317_002386 [Molorchus minor]|uniref:Uncharacterized protein n=1 Tax=Molorchus minor TaxID=1323400 RepID=A0ABQ9IPJ1_9CUCU|nr:hypothetical protein NQ317_002386 [Molorchus minor]